jgi:hypothetical protein
LASQAVQTHKDVTSAAVRQAVGDCPDINPGRGQFAGQVGLDVEPGNESAVLLGEQTGR